jgi:hypothetical protein
MLEFIKMINYKKLVDSLSDENITKKAYDKALSQISDRVNEIWRYICKVSKRKLEWYAFSNDVEYGDGDGSSGGEFDPSLYSKYIDLIGEYQTWYDGNYDYDDGFPTELLWDVNWQTTIKNHTSLAKKAIEEKKNKTVLAKEEKTEKDKLMKQKVKDKLASFLTKEELKYVKIK